jgi:hypothetical protein
MHWIPGFLFFQQMLEGWGEVQRLGRYMHTHTVYDRMFRVGQNRIHAPYMTKYLVMFPPKVPYMHHTYVYVYIVFRPTLNMSIQMLPCLLL